MDAAIEVDEKLVEAFHRMFDHFPEGAQLTHKSKTIVALNPASKALGREIGMICAQHGPAEAHKGCLANTAVNHHTATWALGAQAVPNGQVSWGGLMEPGMGGLMEPVVSLPVGSDFPSLFDGYATLSQALSASLGER